MTGAAEIRIGDRVQVTSGPASLMGHTGRVVGMETERASDVVWCQVMMDNRQWFGDMPWNLISYELTRV